MTLPLKATSLSNRELELQQLNSEELALLRYNLRVAYATHVSGFGSGAVRMGDTSGHGPQFGTVSDVVRGQITSPPHPHAAPTDTVPTTSSTPYSYRQLPGSAAPTTFEDSYASYNAVSFTELEITELEIRQERSINNIVDAVLADCINEMRTGDEIGTYRIENATMTNGPAGGVWENKNLWFTDSIYQNGNVNTYNLWLKRSGTAPASTAVRPLAVLPDGQIVTIEMDPSSPLFEFLCTILKSRVSASLTYRLGTGIDNSNLNRGYFIESQFSGVVRSPGGPQSGDDYRTTATPSTPIAMTTYYLGLV